jgi:DNA-binding NtrC family response regulator
MLKFVFNKTRVILKSACNPTIFIVDSNPVYGKLVQQYLEIADYKETLIFSNAGECLNYLDLQPDIIISEFHQPDPVISGLNFLKIIKKESPQSDVVFFTSHTNLENAIKAIRMGAAEYILKSKYAPDSLIRKVNKIINRRHELLLNTRARNRLMASVGFLIILTLLLVYIYIH